MKRLLLIGVMLLTLAGAAGGLIASKTALALDAKNDVCSGVGSTSGEDGCKSPGPSINKIIIVVIRIFSSIVAFVAIIMILVAGFRYMTSGGDAGNISSAKNTLIYAIVGLVIAAFAQFIVMFVLDKIK